MKLPIKIGLFLSFLFGTQNVFAQDTVHVKTELEEGLLIDGKKEGEWVYRLKNERIYLRQSYREGVVHGKSIFYYKSNEIPPSSVEWELNFNYGQKEGVQFSFHPDGSKLGETSHRNGKTHGISKYYYPNGLPQHVENYSEGKKHGIEAWFSESGDTLKIFNYSEDKIFGIQKIFKDGLLYKTGFFCKDFDTKTERIVDDNMYFDSEYIEYKLNGVWLKYNSAGEVISKECWDCGKIIPCKEE